MKLKTRCMETLTDEEMARIWESALRVWSRVPLRARGPEEFTQALRDFGCEVQGDLIRFPEPVRERVLGRIALERVRRGPHRPAEVQDGRVRRITNGQAFFCHDLASSALRPATTEDLARWSWVCDGYPDLERAHPTFIPQDVPLEARDVHTFATIILNSRRPCRVAVLEAAMLPHFISLQAVCEGSIEAVRENPVFNVTCYANSPFTISPEALEVAMAARRLLGKPLTISAMPVIGSAAPVTLAGSLVQSTAECLAMNAVTLAVDDRLNGWAEAAVVMDMKTGMAAVNGPDVAVARLAYAQMGAFVFGGPFTASGGLNTTAKAPGPQAAIEKSLEAMWCLCAGVRAFSSLGVLGTSDVASVTQLMIDLEIVSYLERLAKGVETTQEHLAEGLICEVAPRGSYYLGEMHTAAHFREELWMPELMDRRVTMAWVNDPVTMLQNAVGRARRVSDGAENRCPLDDARRREVEAIVKEARGLAGTGKGGDRKP